MRQRLRFRIVSSDGDVYGSFRRPQLKNVIENARRRILKFFTSHEFYLITRNFRNPLCANAIGKNKVFDLVVSAGSEQVSCNGSDDCSAIAIR